MMVVAALMLGGCSATKTLTPLGDQTFKIDVSAPASFTRAEVQQAANIKAATATLENGFDRFIILSGRSWTESETYTDTYRVQGRRHDRHHDHHRHYDPYYDDGRYVTTINTVRHPEATLTIKMLNHTDKGASDAVDARAFLAKAEQE